MGVSIVASGSIILILLISIGFGLLYANVNAASGNEAAYKISRLIDEYRIETLIKIMNVTFNSLQQVNVTIKNVGNTKIWKYQFCDVVVTYIANVSNSLIKLTTRLTYSQSGGLGTWYVWKIINDYVDPGILNPNESMIITLTLPYPSVRGTVLVIVFSTDNGVWDSYGVIVP